MYSSIKTAAQTLRQYTARLKLAKQYLNKCNNDVTLARKMLKVTTCNNCANVGKILLL